jgi:hypoxanthine phosphoribosyltransferase
MKKDIPCELVSWERVQEMSRDLALRIQRDGFVADIIIALGRGGWVPGRLLSDNLGLPNLTEFKVEHYTGIQMNEVARVRYPLAADPSGQRVLVVDDVTDTGDSFEVALAHIRERGEPADMRTLALHHKRVSPYEPDYFGALVTDWRWIIYPWALVEDLGTLIAALEPRPMDPALLSDLLLERHGMRVPPETLRQVLELMSVS